MALFFEIADDGVTTESSLAENLFDLEQILFLQSHFEYVVSVVNLNYLHFTSSIEGKDLVLHKERYIHWVLK